MAESKGFKPSYTVTHDHATHTHAVHTGEDSLLQKRSEDLTEHFGLSQAATNISCDAARLSPAHRDYLVELHGTLELDPLPGYGNADPYNWPKWKVYSFVDR